MIGGQGYWVPYLQSVQKSVQNYRIYVFYQWLQVKVPIETLRALLAPKQQAKKVRLVNSKTKFALILSEQFRALVCVPGASNCSLLRPLKQTVPYSTMGYENNTTATIFITDQS